MRKFKVGDRVTVNDKNLPKGQTGTVVEDRGLWWDVALDDPPGAVVSDDSLWVAGLFEKQLCLFA